MARAPMKKRDYSSKTVFRLLCPCNCAYACCGVELAFGQVLIFHPEGEDPNIEISTWIKRRLGFQWDEKSKTPFVWHQKGEFIIMWTAEEVKKLLFTYA